MSKAIEKAHMNVVVVGHLNSGKSTMTGHLLYKCGAIDQGTMEGIEKETWDKGKWSCKYAWLMDKLEEERQAGITLENSIGKFETPKFSVTITDTPGEHAFSQKLIEGTSPHTHAAILVVSSVLGEFEDRYWQIREQAKLAYSRGIRQFIVAVNKMDTTEPPYSEKRFEDIKWDMKQPFTEIDFDPSSVAFVPISGWNGDNLLEASKNMPWFKGWKVERKEGNAVTEIAGKTLIEALDAAGP